MYKGIINELNGKNIAILGFGREGQSSYKFIKKHCKDYKISILDLADIRDNFKEKYPMDKVDFVIGSTYLDNLSIYDLIIKTPGVSLKDIDISNFEDRISSQLELFFKYYGQNAIAITGTKGKSTTASLIYEVIKEQKANSFLMGNIGIPVFDQIEEYDENSSLVVEVSSHQAEFLNYSAHIALILNLFEDHLDKAGTLEHYHEIKMRLFKKQKKDDLAFYFYDNDALKVKVEKAELKTNFYALSLDEKQDIYKEDNKYYFKDKEIYDEADARELLGKHNVINIVFALAVCEALGFDNKKARRAVSKFKTIEYRNEKIGEVNGVSYYVDTLATIPEATIASIDALKSVETLIFGGLDRGIDYSSLIEYFNQSEIKNYIAMPATGNKIAKEIKAANIYYIEDLEDAVNKAHEITNPGSICLLSPAAASYEYYKNYKEKAEAYKTFVENLNRK